MPIYGDFLYSLTPFKVVYFLLETPSHLVPQMKWQKSPKNTPGTMVNKANLETGWQSAKRACRIKKILAYLFWLFVPFLTGPSQAKISPAMDPSLKTFLPRIPSLRWCYFFRLKEEKCFKTSSKCCTQKQHLNFQIWVALFRNGISIWHPRLKKTRMLMLFGRSSFCRIKPCFIVE